MKFDIITPERVVFSDDVSQVTMTTTNGEITVLPHHVPLVTVLKPGELRYKKGSEEFLVAVSGGFAEVRTDNSIKILADTAEHAHEIDIARAEAARFKATQLMSEARNKDDVNYAALSIKIEKELNRLRVGNRYKNVK